jgi:GDP-L-fucose synthase
MIKSQKILITGGGGMVGRNLQGHARASSHTILAPRSADLDLTNAASTNAYIAHHQPDLIIHAAGKVGGIQANIAAPVEFLELNTTIGRNILMAARAARIPRLLNLSSSCMYPAAGRNPLTEDQILTGPLEPTNEGYALAKIFAMRLCDYITREDPELQYKTLIPCNLYGPHDKFDPSASHLLPAIITKVHDAMTTGEASVEIWGDGTARREFMYAEDAADGIWHAVENFETLPALMNLGLGHDHSVNEYYAAAAAAIGWQGDFTHDLIKPVGMKQKLTSVDKQTTWGWQPNHSLTKGILKTYQFYLEHHAP